jgi:tRNA-2-methylthio-N6-dimethylallyladenosine synthase
MQRQPVTLFRDHAAAKGGAAPLEGTTSPSYHIWTIGCQMNTADSERLAGALDQLGFRQAASPAEADVVVLNSCVVRQSAEDKVTGRLGLMKPLKQKRPDQVLALMGCMVGPKHDDLERRFPHVDVFMGPQEYRPLLDLLGQRYGIDWEGCIGPLLPAHPEVSSYVPIIHGCDLFCAFCIIPYRRGRQVSRPIPELVREVELLAARGVREVTLLGQTVDAYGRDLPEQPDLADLFHAIHDTPGLDRIRFLTSHPSFMSQRIIQAVADLPKVCEQINLPIQAGDDAVLERMRRTYTVAHYRELVSSIHQTVPGVALSTDVIVGFCGETDAEFQHTLDLLQDLRFDKVHVAAYSTREGTIAARRLEDTVPREEKDRRRKAVEELQEKTAAAINAPLQGQTLEVLVDGMERGRWKGRTRTDKLVFFSHGGASSEPTLGTGVQEDRNLQLQPMGVSQPDETRAASWSEGEADYHGQMVQVRIDKSSAWSLQGTPVAREEQGKR